jgi:hypothetical protein
MTPDARPTRLRPACPHCGGPLARDSGAELGLSVSEFLGQGSDVAMRRYWCQSCRVMKTAERVYRGGRVRLA